MAKFNVGDKVRVIGCLKSGSSCNGVHINSDMERMSKIGATLTIDRICNGYYSVIENSWDWDADMLELLEPVCEIADYKYNPKTGETYIKWTDKTETKVRPAEGTKPNQYVGFVTAFAKKAAGNTSRINNLFDKWAVKMPAKAEIEAKKTEVKKAEAKRIAAKRKAKKEKWLLRREALRRKRAYEAAQLAQEKYGVPVDFNEEN